MRKLATGTFVAVAIFVAITGPSLAQGMAAPGSGGGPHGGDGHHESDSHHRGDHDGDRDDQHGRRHLVGGPVTYWNYPYYVAPTAGYWYYCPSAEAYYPYVTYCLDAWVPVPVR